MMEQEQEPTKRELRKTKIQFCGILFIMAGCHIILALLCLLSMSKAMKHWKELIEFLHKEVANEMPTEEETRNLFNESS